MAENNISSDSKKDLKKDSDLQKTNKNQFSLKIFVWSLIFFIFAGILVVWFLNATGIIGIDSFILFENSAKKILVFEGNKNSQNFLHFLDKDANNLAKITTNEGMPTLDYQLIDKRAYYFDTNKKLVAWIDESGNAGKLAFTKTEDYSLSFLISADNNQIIWSKFKSDDSGKTENTLYSANIDGQNQKQILQKNYEEAKYIKPYRWSEDNSIIYFSEDSYGDSDVTSNILCGGIWKLILKDGTINEILKADKGCVYDLATNEKYLIYSKVNKNNDQSKDSDNDLVIYNLNNKQETSIDIDKNSVVDSAYFSPNSRKIIIDEVERKPNQAEKHVIWLSDLFSAKNKIAENHSVRSWLSNKEILTNKIGQSLPGLYKTNINSKEIEKFTGYEFIDIEW